MKEKLPKFSKFLKEDQIERQREYLRSGGQPKVGDTYVHPHNGAIYKFDGKSWNPTEQPNTNLRNVGTRFLPHEQPAQFEPGSKPTKEELAIAWRNARTHRDPGMREKWKQYAMQLTNQFGRMKDAFRVTTYQIEYLKTAIKAGRWPGKPAFSRDTRVALVRTLQVYQAALNHEKKTGKPVWLTNPGVHDAIGKGTDEEAEFAIKNYIAHQSSGGQAAYDAGRRDIKDPRSKALHWANVPEKMEAFLKDPLGVDGTDPYTDEPWFTPEQKMAINKKSKEVMASLIAKNQEIAKRNTSERARVAKLNKEIQAWNDANTGGAGKYAAATPFLVAPDISFTKAVAIALLISAAIYTTTPNGRELVKATLEAGHNVSQETADIVSKFIGAIFSGKAAVDMTQEVVPGVWSGGNPMGPDGPDPFLKQLARALKDGAKWLWDKATAKETRSKLWKWYRSLPKWIQYLGFYHTVLSPGSMPMNFIYEHHARSYRGDRRYPAGHDREGELMDDWPTDEVGVPSAYGRWWWENGGPILKYLWGIEGEGPRPGGGHKYPGRSAYVFDLVFGRGTPALTRSVLPHGVADLIGGGEYPEQPNVDNYQFKDVFARRLADYKKYYAKNPAAGEAYEKHMRVERGTYFVNGNMTDAFIKHLQMLETMELYNHILANNHRRFIAPGQKFSDKYPTVHKMFFGQTGIDPEIESKVKELIEGDKPGAFDELREIVEVLTDAANRPQQTHNESMQLLWTWLLLNNYQLPKEGQAFMASEPEKLWVRELGRTRLMTEDDLAEDNDEGVRHPGPEGQLMTNRELIESRATGKIVIGADGSVTFQRDLIYAYTPDPKAIEFYNNQIKFAKALIAISAADLISGAEQGITIERRKAEIHKQLPTLIKELEKMHKFYFNKGEHERLRHAPPTGGQDYGIPKSEKYNLTSDKQKIWNTYVQQR